MYTISYVFIRINKCVLKYISINPRQNYSFRNLSRSALNTVMYYTKAGIIISGLVHFTFSKANIDQA